MILSDESVCVLGFVLDRCVGFPKLGLVMERRNVRKQRCVENRNSRKNKKRKLEYLTVTMWGMLNVTRISARQENSMSFVVYYIFFFFFIQNASDCFSLSGKLSCGNSRCRWHKQSCSHFEL